MKEQVFTASNGVEVRFKHKPQKYDYNHIIFVFSGFNNPLPGRRWDFINAMTDCPSEVIWISDDFEGMHSYYLCIDMDFKVEIAVTEFIRTQLAERGLSGKNVTLTGFSKGATAALYYGLKLNISNMVLTVPQSKIGSYVDFEWQDAAKHMMGKNYTSMHMKYLDNIIPRVIKEDEFHDRNIYLLTSEEDVQYNVHIQPILNDMAKYSNFNLLKSHSLLVRQHRDVAVHHTAILLSIYYALSSEAIPRFNNGQVDFYGNQKVQQSPVSLETHVDLQELQIKSQTLYIEGVGLLRGWHTDKWSDISYELLVKGSKDYSYILAAGHRPALTRQHYQSMAVTYDKSWFTTKEYKGLDISNIDAGVYELYLKIKVEEHELECKLSSSKNISSVFEVACRSYSFKSDSFGNELIVK